MFEKTWIYLYDNSVNFYTCLTCWLCVWSFIGGGIIAAVDNLSYLDGLYLAVSAITGTGLNSISMVYITTPSLIVLQVLIVVGLTPLLPLGPMLYRLYAYRRIMTNKSNVHINSADSRVLAEFELQDKAIQLMAWRVVVYCLFWLLFGIIFISAALYLQPLEPELASRGFTNYQSGSFIAG